ncbi:MULTISPECIES: LysR family transcriptional regulator [Colwellia]|uniref:LysR family transcriptional regulator n=1 Tax=Colwellia marinimaniae TaxID=1513592 RepID=A0ABQ0MWV3_9GAMM|nr:MULTISPECIES: LysR family transcriptional regulator [Colwellia]GAW96727.1 LysR family transcriptional regulator [Colwellia marinimaniae]
MGQLEDMALLVRIVDAGGIGKAAEQLNMAKSAVSKRLKELENRLGTQLLSRTTRKSALTEAGSLYYQRAITIIDEVAELNALTHGVKKSLSGTLKITMPLSFGLLHLTPVIDEFSQLHPKLKLHIDFVDRHIDLLAEGYELAIRIAELKDSSLQARRLTPIRHVLCASPDFIKKHGSIETLAQLNNLDYLQYGNIGQSHSHLAQSQNAQGKVSLTDAKGKAHTVPLNTIMTANNGDFLKAMAIKGKGVCYLPSFISYQAIQAGQLVPLMSKYQLPIIHAYAVYPQTRFLSERCRLLIDFIAQRFGDKPYWDEY